MHVTLLKRSALFACVLIKAVSCQDMNMNIEEQQQPEAIMSQSPAQLTTLSAANATTVEIVARAVTITASNNATTSQNPSATGTSGSSTAALPTLSSAANTNTIATPSVTVPPNDNNPYISRSKVPEGTVFIAVGSVLGFIALCILLWRFMVHLALQRSIKRAETAYGEDKSLLHNMMTETNTDIGLSGTTLTGAAGDTSRPASRAANTRARMSGIPAQGSLFFSPTADVLHSAQTAAATGGGGAGSSMSSSTVGVGTYGHGHTMSTASINGFNTAGNTTSIRSSTYFPAGNYGGNGGGSIRNVSPGPSRMSMYAQSVRTSTMDHVPHPQQQQQRPPSAYLDDLLGHDSDED